MNRLRIDFRYFSTWSKQTEGILGTKDFRCFLTREDGSKVSPWFDVPLFAPDGLVHYVNEIPRFTSAKMEIATRESPLHPIKQDTKKGVLRYFKAGLIPFNYGCLPMTWENPDEKHPDTGFPGDNDPVDAVEISDAALDMASVSSVRVLGALALIDQGEMDWKVIVLNSSHPLCSQIESVEDIEKHFSLKLGQIREWFRTYKIAEGKEENTYAFNGTVLDANYALSVIKETHNSWKNLQRDSLVNE